MTVRRLAGLTVAAAFGLSSLMGTAATAHADPVDYVKIELIDLTCHQQSEGDHDEAYIKVINSQGNEVKVWPGSAKYQTMGTGYVRPLDDANSNVALILGRTESRTLTLWDYDTTSSDDKLGSVSITGNEVGAETQYRSLEGSGGVYTIAYRVVDI